MDEGREEADDPFRMFDRAADIRCFGNITRKGAPEKVTPRPQRVLFTASAMIVRASGS